MQRRLVKWPVCPELNEHNLLFHMSTWDSQEAHRTRRHCQHCSSIVFLYCISRLSSYLFINQLAPLSSPTCFSRSLPLSYFSVCPFILISVVLPSHSTQPVSLSLYLSLSLHSPPPPFTSCSFVFMMNLVLCPPPASRTSVF